MSYTYTYTYSTSSHAGSKPSAGIGGIGKVAKNFMVKPKLSLLIYTDAGKVYNERGNK